MVLGQQTTPESMLQHMEKQLHDLINGDDKTNGRLVVATPEIEMREMHEKGRNRVASGNDKVKAARRRSTIDVPTEFFDSEDDDDDGYEEDDDLDSSIQSRKNINNMLLDYSLIVGNPERNHPLENAFSDELSLSSLGSQIEGRNSTTISPSTMKYNTWMASTSDTTTSNTAASSQDGSALLTPQVKPANTSHHSNKSSSMDIHDAVDAIREEASKMEAAFAIDRLQTMEGELNSIKKLLHAQTDQIDFLKKEVKSKDESLAILQLERDLIQADMEAYEVSGRFANRIAHQGMPVSPSPAAFTPKGAHGIDPKSPPVLTRCNTKSPTSLGLKNKGSILKTAERSQLENETKGIGFVSEGSAFSPAKETFGKKSGAKGRSSSPQGAGSHDGSRGASSKSSAEENRAASSKKSTTISRFKPIATGVIKQQKGTPATPVKVVAPTAIAYMRGSPPLPSPGIANPVYSDQNSILANEIGDNSILEQSIASSSSSLFSERKSIASNSLVGLVDGKKGAKFRTPSKSAHSVTSIGGSTDISNKSKRSTNRATKSPKNSVTASISGSFKAEEYEPNHTRICGASLFRRRKALHKETTTKRQSHLLAENDRKKKTQDCGQSLQAQVEELAQRLRSSVEGSEDLRKRLAMISRYYESTVHSLHENIVSLKKEQTSMQVDLTTQIKNIDRERLVAIKRTQLLLQSEEIARFKKKH